jgi:hypothetical protein
MPIDFSDVNTSNVLADERGRRMLFPSRRDYLDLLLAQSIIKQDSDFGGRTDLVEEVYLDWLKRSQVGCVLAQLLGRGMGRRDRRQTPRGLCAVPWSMMPSTS